MMWAIAIIAGIIAMLAVAGVVKDFIDLNRAIKAREGRAHLARHIAATLGYTNTSKAISDHCRGVTNRYPIVDSLGRTQEATFISEGDVYRLIVSSQLPAARVRALALRRGRPADPPHRRIHPGTSRRR